MSWRELFSTRCDSVNAASVDFHSADAIPALPLDRAQNDGLDLHSVHASFDAMSQANAKHIWLIRHGETEWSKSGQHTGTSDIPLTDAGRAQAAAIKPLLAAQSFDLVLTSPMQRAIETCRLAGLGEHAQIEANLHEWNYGIYEGRKTVDIRADVPDWSVWTSPIPEGENAADVGRRAQALIDQLLGSGAQQIALFSHAHFLRTLGAVWASGSAAFGAHLVMDTAAVSVLGFERDVRAILKWNLQS
jgi:broad specificity phosphatase PhoE